MEEKYFETVSVPRAIAKFAIPTILSQLVTLMYNLADTFFVGHTNDPNQVAALTLSFPIFMVLNCIGNLFGMGANSLMSRSLGRKEPEQAKKASAFAFWGAVLLAAVVSILLAVYLRPVLDVVGASEYSYPHAAAYLRWTVIIGGVPSVAALMMGHMLRGEGNTRQASIGIALGGILNIILDPVFIFGLNMGTAGAGAATALSNTISLVYQLVILLRVRGKTVITLNPALVRYWREVAKETLLVGLPAAMVIVMGSSANIVMTHLMSAYGDTAVAAYGVVQKISTVTIQITIGLTQGIMPLVGYNFAAGNAKRTSDIMRWSTILVGAYAAMCMLLVELVPAFWVKLFISEAQTVALGSAFVRRLILCAPGMCYVMLLNTVFQAMGYWKQSTFLTLFRQGVLLIPLLFLLNHVLGMYGLLFGSPIADTASFLVGYMMYLKLRTKAAA